MCGAGGRSLERSAVLKLTKMDVVVGTRNTFSHLPLIRFTTITTVLVATESLLCFASCLSLCTVNGRCLCTL